MHSIFPSKNNSNIKTFFLFVLSLSFYAYWNLEYLPLLVCSLLLNYSISLMMDRINNKFLYIGLFFNIGLLIYFKYSQFLISNYNFLFNEHYHVNNASLPLGISFFTFTQIAYLVDHYKKNLSTPNFLNYGLFVTFFPHIMAGPILHHQEIIPQLKSKISSLFTWENLAIGLAIFSIGMAKKFLIADTLALYVNPIFKAASNGHISCREAWYGSLAYTFQLYFDFSGYSDMAIGLARIFGIIFPMNFNSPYKALNIIQFWRRWHMTLSRFLRDYLYIPLGGSRMTQTRRYINLIATMLIGGIWHGAAWTFVAWGFLHGAYLTINHLWRNIQTKYFEDKLSQNKTYILFSQLLTFLAVLVGWVFFRSDSFATSAHLLQSMFMPMHNITSSIFSGNETHILTGFLIGAAAIVFFAPNTQQILHQYRPAIEIYSDEIKPYIFKITQWNPKFFYAGLCATLTVFSLLTLSHVNEFLYYKF